MKSLLTLVIESTMSMSLGNLNGQRACSLGKSLSPTSISFHTKDINKLVFKDIYKLVFKLDKYQNKKPVMNFKLSDP